MTLTDEQLRLLAEAERQMDAGEVPFVNTNGGRLMVTSEAMAHFGLVSGQSVSSAMAAAITKHHYNECVQRTQARKRPN